MKRMVALAAFLSMAAAAFAQDQQIGARTKGMGGSYTAFEDDPVSVWLNPAGISTQPDQMSLSYQTYSAYKVESERNPNDPDDINFSVNAEPILVEPAIIPGYLGFTFQLGTPESPWALGFCYARPYHLYYAVDQISDPNQKVFEPENDLEQALQRFRVALGKDWRIKPAGEPGFLTHVSVGAGVDLAYVSWQFRFPDASVSQNAIGMGYGLGLLVGMYDSESFRVNLGVAFQSKVEFDFDIQPDILPAFDMPQQLNIGATFYLLAGTPLRITADFQFIDWEEVAEKPLFAGQPTFRDVQNFSVGVEYRIKLTDKFNLYPRLGYRKFEAPWDDETNLPAIGGYKLVLDTDDSEFTIVTGGIGLSWSNEAGKSRSVDLGVDTGGDNYNVAMGYTQEF